MVRGTTAGGKRGSVQSHPPRSELSEIPSAMGYLINTQAITVQTPIPYLQTPYNSSLTNTGRGQQ